MPATAGPRRALRWLFWLGLFGLLVSLGVAGRRAAERRSATGEPQRLTARDATEPGGRP